MNNISLVTRKIATHKLPDGSEIVLCSFGPIDWAAVEEGSLDYFKRQLIKTWTDNLDLLPESDRSGAIKSAYREAQRVTKSDLPKMRMDFPQLGGEDEPVIEDGKVKMVSKEVDYASWWMGDTVDGKLHALWLSARKAAGQEKWTKAEVAEKFQAAMVHKSESVSAEIEAAAQTVGRISQMELGKNSSSPLATEGMTKRQRRLAQRQARMARRTASG